MDFMPSNTTPPVKLDTQQAPDASQAPEASGTLEDAIAKWVEHKRRTAATQQPPVAGSAATADKDRAAGALEEQQQNKAPADDQGGGLNHEDPWDRGEIQQPTPEADVDPFAQYRTGKGYALEVPVDGVALDEAAVADWGETARHVGLTPDAAQNLVGMFAGVGTIERARLATGGGTYDPQLSVSELRFEWGTELEPTLSKIEKFCAKHPALSAYLDTTRLGDSPEALRMLAGAATVGTSPDKARAFIASVKKDPKHGYWQGNKLALAQMKWAYAIAGE